MNKKLLIIIIFVLVFIPSFAEGNILSLTQSIGSFITDFWGKNTKAIFDALFKFSATYDFISKDQTSKDIANNLQFFAASIMALMFLLNVLDRGVDLEGVTLEGLTSSVFQYAIAIFFTSHSLTILNSIVKIGDDLVTVLDKSVNADTLKTAPDIVEKFIQNASSMLSGIQGPFGISAGGTYLTITTLVTELILVYVAAVIVFRALALLVMNAVSPIAFACSVSPTTRGITFGFFSTYAGLVLQIVFIKMGVVMCLYKDLPLISVSSLDKNTELLTRMCVLAFFLTGLPALINKLTGTNIMGFNPVGTVKSAISLVR